MSDARVAELLAMYSDPDASVAELLCDRHDPGSVAFRFVSADLSARALSFGELREASERAAAALASLGVGPGDRVGTLMGKTADHMSVLLGIWRLGAVHVPLFTAFAMPAIEVRVAGSAAKAVVCDDTQRPKVPDGPWSIVAPGDLLAGRETAFPAARLGGDAPMVQIYTSGTTGNPKGVIVPTRALASMVAYMEFGCDVRTDDVYWNAADPGWAYGLYYAVIAPLAMGVPSLLLDAGFDPSLAWAVLQTFGVTNFAAAPTIYRAFRAAGLSGVQLRCASSAGEPLTPEVNEWAADALGTLVHDHYGQTETGMLINNHHAEALRQPIEPGCMGRAMPGWAMDVRDGRIVADRSASPLAWFRGYDGGVGGDKFSDDGRWYLTGDTGTVDGDGNFRFVSRDDDVIIMAGYRIGPFEVESVLASHPAVAESAAIAVPDAVRGEVLEAHVVLREPGSGTAALAAELQRLVKERLAAHAYPRQVHFVDALPKTPSGKIQRFVLRQRRREELGEPVTAR